MIKFIIKICTLVNLFICGILATHDWKLALQTFAGVTTGVLLSCAFAYYVQKEMDKL